MVGIHYKILPPFLYVFNEVSRKQKLPTDEAAELGLTTTDLSPSFQRRELQAVEVRLPVPKRTAWWAELAREPGSSASWSSVLSNTPCSLQGERPPQNSSGKEAYGSRWELPVLNFKWLGSLCFDSSLWQKTTLNSLELSCYHLEFVHKCTE